eukprot:TRINITY_DN10314_c0_g1_i2.p1 TRINITY_DN10314_c0_g1~~TRINITY_DN10314_c0_g1_i2.p1  ORF type:complete len:109 (+),score=29.95 TRINITY_DN10314_c0_g1_i2:189-515(+)
MESWVVISSTFFSREGSSGINAEYGESPTSEKKKWRAVHRAMEQEQTKSLKKHNSFFARLRIATKEIRKAVNNNNPNNLIFTLLSRKKSRRNHNPTLHEHFSSFLYYH